MMAEDPLPMHQNSMHAVLSNDGCGPDGPRPRLSVLLASEPLAAPSRHSKDHFGELSVNCPKFGFMGSQMG